MLSCRIYMTQFAYFLMVLAVFASSVCAKIPRYTFVIQEAPYTRLCDTKNILTVNGLFPGPTISATSGDTIYVRVINKGNKNITLHWHGVKQPRDPWSDGPEYITQCPIKPGASFTQRINLTEEEGTLWWHAHSDLDLATVHGAIIIYPKHGSSYPFPVPHDEFTLILGEWWKNDMNDVYQTAVKSGGEFEPSDANTINGQPGDYMPCSANDTYKVQVEQGKMYLLRIINAALSNEYFFAVSGHNITVVGEDGSYTKPHDSRYIFISPGQTIDVLLHANQFQNSSSPYRYYIVAEPFFNGNASLLHPDLKRTVAILEYKSSTYMPQMVPVSDTLPSFNDTNAAVTFTAGLRSLASSDHPIDVPLTVHLRMYITVSLNEQLCTNVPCAGSDGNRFASSLNNASFQTPLAKIDVLDAYYSSISGVYTANFPNQPPLFFNFTDANIPKQLLLVEKSTKVKVLDYNTTVEIVFQGTNLLGGGSHPMHLHGQSFFVMAKGFGNFDKTKDPLTYNLVDPPLVNTASVPKNGWATIRFRAANPGVWLMHCHLESHLLWGMDTVFITKNGNNTDARMLPPPEDKPPC